MRIAAALVGVALCAAASDARAQTNCRVGTSGRLECREDAGAQAEHANRENMDRLRKFMDDDSSPADIEAARKRTLHKKVAKLVKAGKCNEAKATALDAGDLDTPTKPSASARLRRRPRPDRQNEEWCRHSNGRNAPDSDIGIRAESGRWVRSGR